MQRCLTVCHFTNNQLIGYIRFYNMCFDKLDGEKEMYLIKKDEQCNTKWIKILCIAANHQT